MPAPIVFFDIAGPQSESLKSFYSDLFDWNIADNGSFSVPVATPMKASIREDPADKMFYVGVADIAATLKSVEGRGGTITAPRFEVPGVVVLGLFADPAGNHVGLVELDGDEVKVP